jgi:hypothetical protein
MMVVLPVSLFAQENAAAILRSDGVGVMVNRNPALPSVALFPDDFIETQKAAVARIEASGSTADLSPETIVQFDGDELVLDHGGLSVNTSRGMQVRVGCVTITPVNNAEWTHYDVVDRDGKVTVSASKNDVYIDARSRKEQQAKPSSHSSRDIVREGERKSREEKCGGAYPPAPASAAGAGAIMNSPWVLAAAAGGVAVILCMGLLCRDDDAMSPAKP